MHPITVRAIEIEDAIASAEYDVVRAKACAYDLLMHRLQGVLWHARVSHDASEPVEVKADGAEPQPTEAPPAAQPDADPFASPQPSAEAQPQPRRSGRRSRRTEEGQPTAADAQPTPDPTSAPQPDEGQPLTAEALGLAPEPAAQPLPLPVVEAPDLSAAPATTDDVYGTEPAEDPFA